MLGDASAKARLSGVSIELGAAARVRETKRREIWAVMPLIGRAERTPFPRIASTEDSAIILLPDPGFLNPL